MPEDRLAGTAYRKYAEITSVVLWIVAARAWLVSTPRLLDGLTNQPGLTGVHLESYPLATFGASGDFHRPRALCDLPTGLNPGLHVLAIHLGMSPETVYCPLPLRQTWPLSVRAPGRVPEAMPLCN